MPIKSKPTKYAFVTEGESLTEQEHKNSCDINLMLKNAARGLQIRGGAEPQYGYDDLTMDGVQFRITKDRLEQEMEHMSKTQEFSQEELDAIPDSVKKKYKFRKKADQTGPKSAKNDETKNDEKAPTSPEPAKETENTSPKSDA